MTNPKFTLPPFSEKLIFKEEKSVQTDFEIEKKVEKQKAEFVGSELIIEKKEKINKEKPFFVLISGGAASGKSTLTKQIKKYFEQNYQEEVLTISIDSYYAFSPLLFHLRNPNLQQVFK
jgi:pantothenate kinase-related protein Tda10